MYIYFKFQIYLDADACNQYRSQHNPEKILKSSTLEYSGNLKSTLARSRRHADVINGCVTVEAAADDSPEYDAIGGSLRREVHHMFVPHW